MPRKTDSDEVQLRRFIAKFEARNQALIRSLHRALRKRLPTANELVYDNYNFFVIGYCTSERPSDSLFRWLSTQRVRGFLSIVARRSPILTRFCKVPGARTGLYVWMERERWANQRCRSCSRLWRRKPIRRFPNRAREN